MYTYCGSPVGMVGTVGKELARMIELERSLYYGYAVGLRKGAKQNELLYRLSFLY